MNKQTIIEQGTNAAVVGFGRAGQALVRYLHKCGANVLVSDTQIRTELSTQQQELLDDCSVMFEGGGHSAEFLGQAEIIIVSPGVDYHHPALIRASELAIPILGELALASDKFNAPVIAVTGTNGKTTVTELIGSLLQGAGKKVFIGGNIGTPIGDYLFSEEDYEVIVLEVSSFQLELCGEFAPQVGLLLNITPDHLDRHKTLENYAAAKMRIFQGNPDRSFAIINAEDPLCTRYRHLSARKDFGLFGYDGQCDAVVAGTRIVMSSTRPEQSYDLGGTALDNLSGMLNSAAALLALSRFELDQNALQQGLELFQAGEHRMQQVGKINGIAYINDSKATNTGAVNNAIFQIGGSIILIAGGRDKGDDYSLLRQSVANHVKKLILIGEAAEKLGETLADLVPTAYPASLEEAVEQASSAAVPGDTVLLSPACASFDMFDNYQHRGICFSDTVRQLADHSFSGVSQ